MFMSLIVEVCKIITFISSVKIFSQFIFTLCNIYPAILTFLEGSMAVFMRGVCFLFAFESMSYVADYFSLDFRTEHFVEAYINRSSHERLHNNINRWSE